VPVRRQEAYENRRISERLGKEPKGVAPASSLRSSRVLQSGRLMTALSRLLAACRRVEDDQTAAANFLVGRALTRRARACTDASAEHGSPPGAEVAHRDEIKGSHVRPPIPEGTRADDATT
jgi:hypothetical protein